MSFRFQNKPRIALREAITPERAEPARQCRDAHMLLRAAAELLSTHAVSSCAQEPLGEAIGHASRLLSAPGKHPARSMNAAIRRVLSALSDP